jgi:cytochrome c2
VIEGRSIIRMGLGEVLFLLALSGAYVLAAGFNVVSLRRSPERSSVALTLLVVLSAFGIAALGLTIIQAPFVSRAILVPCLVITALMLMLPRWVRAGWLTAGAIVLIVAGAGLQAADRTARGYLNRLSGNQPGPQRSTSLVHARYVTLSATYYDNYFPNCNPQTGSCDYTPQTGGGLEDLGEGYLVATGEGILHYFTRDAQGELHASRLPYQVPLNAADFAESGESEYGRGVFRVTDILLEEEAGQVALFAAHHYYYKESDCVVLRLSIMRGSSERIINGTQPEHWETVYETKPCMPRSTGPKNLVFHGEESGGRLARLDPATLLMTTGDHQFDGWNSDKMAAQDLASNYGKVLAVDLESATASVYTFGHRNPQGLFVTKSGDIWATEHGPQGGDELNRLVRGTNYGWPLATYGTDYGDHNTWPVSLTPNDHRGFEEPVYSWVPSIAISNLLMVEKNRFPAWQGDLLIGSFGESLYRARLRAGRVVTLESIRLRTRRDRIRDLLEDKNGNIVLYFDDGPVAFLEPAGSASTPAAGTTTDRGQSLFGACIGCHAVADGATHRLGPDLAGIIGRPIGGSDGFRYSPALTTRSGRWTEESLDRFLANPQAFAPGNTMVFPGVADADDRAQLIKYLKQARPAGR